MEISKQVLFKRRVLYSIILNGYYCSLLSKEVCRVKDLGLAFCCLLYIIFSVWHIWGVLILWNNEILKCIKIISKRYYYLWILFLVIISLILIKIISYSWIIALLPNFFFLLLLSLTSKFNYFN